MMYGKTCWRRADRHIGSYHCMCGWCNCVVLWLWRIRSDSCLSCPWPHPMKDVTEVQGTGSVHTVPLFPQKDRKFYVKVFNLLHMQRPELFLGAVSRIWQPPTHRPNPTERMSGKDNKLSWLVSFLWQLVKKYKNRTRLVIFYFSTSQQVPRKEQNPQCVSVFVKTFKLTHSVRDSQSRHTWLLLKAWTVGQKYIITFLKKAKYLIKSWTL